MGTEFAQTIRFGASVFRRIQERRANKAGNRKTGHSFQTKQRAIY